MAATAGMTNGGPLYERVENELRERIATGVYRSGEMIPTEAQLCGEFGVSRITVRRALDGLTADRLIHRQAGSGTRVADPEEITKSVTLSGFIEDAIPLNHYELVSDRAARVPDSVLQMLQVPGQSSMRRIVAVNSPGGQPLAVSEFYFPGPLARFVCTEDFFGGTSVIRRMEMRSGVVLNHAEQLVEAALAPVWVARRLGIEPSTPVLRTLRCFFGSRREPLQAVLVHHHPQRYRFAAKLIPKVVPLRRRSSE